LTSHQRTTHRPPSVQLNLENSPPAGQENNDPNVMSVVLDMDAMKLSDENLFNVSDNVLLNTTIEDVSD
jgi:hypothetical protein